jgi:hypothetical protein
VPNDRELLRRVVVRLAAATAVGALRVVERRPANRSGASEPRVVAVNDDIEVRVRWIDRPGEVGPTWSAFGGRHEIVRVDLFPGSAHVHPLMGLTLASNVAGHRYRLRGDTFDECIATGVDECRRHLAYHVAGHPSRRLRRATPTDEQVARAADWLESELADLVVRRG